MRKFNAVFVLATTIIVLAIGARLIADDARPNIPAGERRVVEIDGVEYAFRWAPPGKFTMGSPENEEDRESYEYLIV
ncbi:MAG: hypothetical protein HUK22_04550, partial [Thermoguttaceae bacterium]|nr:hypothetical protein [Thermoguttaceae bacterium]